MLIRKRLEVIVLDTGSDETDSFTVLIQIRYEMYEECMNVNVRYRTVG